MYTDTRDILRNTDPHHLSWGHARASRQESKLPVWPSGPPWFGPCCPQPHPLPLSQSLLPRHAGRLASLERTVRRYDVFTPSGDSACSLLLLPLSPCPKPQLLLTLPKEPPGKGVNLGGAMTFPVPPPEASPGETVFERKPDSIHLHGNGVPKGRV